MGLIPLKPAAMTVIAPRANILNVFHTNPPLPIPAVTYKSARTIFLQT